MLPLIFAYLAGVVSVLLWAFIKGVAILEQKEREEAEKNKENKE